MPIYIHRDGQQFGPYTIEQARDYLEAGNLVADDLAWYDGAEGWAPLGQIPGVATSRAPAPAASSAPAWVPPRRDATSSEPVGFPGQIGGAVSAISAAPAPAQPAPGQPSVGQPAAMVAPAAQRDPASRGYDPMRSAQRSIGARNMGVGGLIFVVGSAITFFTYEAAAESPGGGHYVMAWGAIVFGGIQFVKGLIQFCKG